MCFDTECIMTYKVIQDSKVVDFGTERKRVYDFLLVLNSDLGFVLPKATFPFPTPILATVSECSNWSR